MSSFDNHWEAASEAFAAEMGEEMLVHDSHLVAVSTPVTSRDRYDPAAGGVLGHAWPKAWEPAPGSPVEPASVRLWVWQATVERVCGRRKTWRLPKREARAVVARWAVRH